MRWHLAVLFLCFRCNSLDFECVHQIRLHCCRLCCCCSMATLVLSCFARCCAFNLRCTYTHIHTYAYYTCIVLVICNLQHAQRHCCHRCRCWWQAAQHSVRLRFLDLRNLCANLWIVREVVKLSAGWRDVLFCAASPRLPLSTRYPLLSDSKCCCISKQNNANSGSK